MSDAGQWFFHAHGAECEPTCVLERLAKGSWEPVGAGRAVQDDGLDVERLAVAIKEWGRYAGVGYGALPTYWTKAAHMVARSYLRAAPPLHDPTPPVTGAPILGEEANDGNARYETEAVADDEGPGGRERLSEVRSGVGHEGSPGLRRDDDVLPLGAGGEVRLRNDEVRLTKPGRVMLDWLNRMQKRTGWAGVPGTPAILAIEEAARTEGRQQAVRDAGHALDALNAAMDDGLRDDPNLLEAHATLSTLVAGLNASESPHHAGDGCQFDGDPIHDLEPGDASEPRPTLSNSGGSVTNVPSPEFHDGVRATLPASESGQPPEASR